ncbi:MAG: hypothetical protein ACLTE4_06010 [Christensenellaceae bacterium]
MQCVSCNPLDSAVMSTSQSLSFSVSNFAQCSVNALSPCRLKNAIDTPLGRGRTGSFASKP